MNTEYKQNVNNIFFALASCVYPSKRSTNLHMGYKQLDRISNVNMAKGVTKYKMVRTKCSCSHIKQKMRQKESDSTGQEK